MTGYQEVMTDPSYAAQIVTFTFPHIGNVGANAEDVESQVEGAVGCVVREDVDGAVATSAPQRSFDDWMKGHLQDRPRRHRHPRADPPHPPAGAPNAVIAHDPEGKFDIPALLKQAQDWAGLEGMDLAKRRQPREARGLGRRPVGAGPRLWPRTARCTGRMSSRSITAPRTTSSATW